MSKRTTLHDIADEVRTLTAMINALLAGRSDLVATTAIAMVLASHVRTTGRSLGDLLEDLGVAVEGAQA